MKETEKTMTDHCHLFTPSVSEPPAKKKIPKVKADPINHQNHPEGREGRSQEACIYSRSSPRQTIADQVQGRL